MIATTNVTPSAATTTASAAAAANRLARADECREFLLSKADAVADAHGHRAAYGEEVHGVIEWYDRDCIKVNRAFGEPNLMTYKPAIKYMYKEGEGV